MVIVIVILFKIKLITKVCIALTDNDDVTLTKTNADLMFTVLYYST